MNFVRIDCDVGWQGCAFRHEVTVLFSTQWSWIRTVCRFWGDLCFGIWNVFGGILES